jgi:hypothetical protein
MLWGLQCHPRYYSREATTSPTTSVGQTTPKVSMITAAFINCVRQFSKFKVVGTCLIIFDCAKSHMDCGMAETPARFDITPLCLSSNTANELRPMDNSACRTFKPYWHENVQLHWNKNRDGHVLKQRFRVLFTAVRGELQSYIDAKTIKTPHCSYR